MEKEPDIPGEESVIESSVASLSQVGGHSMKEEGYHTIGSIFKYKEWWNFTFFSKKESLVFSCSLVKSPIRDHISSSIWNFRRDEKIQLDFDSKISAAEGDYTDIYSKGDKGILSVKGRFEEGGWELKIKSPELSATLFYKPQCPQKIIEAFWEKKFKCELYAKNEVTGMLSAFGRTFEIDTLGCREHTFCDFPRNTAWNWVVALHSDYSFVISRGNYSGYDYKYAVLFDGKEWIDLDPDVTFVVDERQMLNTCSLTSSDADLKIYPIRHRYEHKKILMGILVDAHYWELATRIAGSLKIKETKIPIDTFGIMTRSRMKW